jgi:hypothetical protein
MQIEQLKACSKSSGCLASLSILFWLNTLFDKSEKPNYFNLSINRSPTLKALAIIVKAGLTAALDGKKLPSTI